MQYHQINKDILDWINEIELTLQTFRGFRHLWADLAANHEPCGVTQEKLEEMQAHTLGLALGQAYTLAKKLGIKWVDCEADVEQCKRVKKLESFVRTIAQDFDCDKDAHRYNTFCRCCEAKKLLNNH